MELKVMALPTLLVYKDGKEMERMSGNVDIAACEEQVLKLL